MIQRIGIIFAIAALLEPSLAVAQNFPLTQAAVGDWVEFKGLAPSILPGADPQTLTMRYTVKAKNGNIATVAAKSWAGDVVVSEQDIEWPMDLPIDGVKLAGAGSKEVSVKLEKKIPNMKYKIGAKEFSGTGYQYKVAIDIGGALGLSEAEKGKPLESTAIYLISPDAPVLGIAAFSMKGLVNVNYELSDGTGVAALIKPPAANAKGKAKAKVKQ